MGIQNIVPYRLPNHKNKRLLDPHVVIVGAPTHLYYNSLHNNHAYD